MYSTPQWVSVEFECERKITVKIETGTKDECSLRCEDGKTKSEPKAQPPKKWLSRFKLGLLMILEWFFAKWFPDAHG